MKIYRINAIILHHLYFWKRSVPRWLDVFYWPVITIFVWGFITMYLRSGASANASSGVSLVGGMLLGGIIFWMVFQRAQQDFSIAFLQDIWSRSIVNLYVSPISNAEFAIASIVIGIIKVLITISIMSSLAFFLYSFNFLQIGFAIIPFVAMLLIFAWALGLFSTGIIFRFGTDAQIIAFSISFILQPFVAVFYPLEILPAWIHPVSLAIPVTHVFEGMRQVLSSGTFSISHFLWALGLNALYLTACSWFFVSMFNKIKKKGMLSKLE